MIKTAIVVIWACAVMFGASLGVGAFLKSREHPPAADTAQTFENRKTKEINVPIIREGAVKGFVVIQLSYVADMKVVKSLPVDPDPFVIDETFRMIFDDSSIDFSHLDKLELDKMTRMLMFKVNARVKAPAIVDMGVVACNFLINAEAKSDVKENASQK